MLNEKQKMFADYYIETLSATESAKRAGYCQRTAVRLMKNKEIKKYIEDIMNSKQDERIASQDEVLIYLTSVMRREQPEEVIVTSQLGTERMNKKTSVTNSTKAAELLGKRYGLFEENINLNATVDIEVKPPTFGGGEED